MKKHLLKFAILLSFPIAAFSQNYNMSNGSANSCTGFFADSGGGGGSG